MSWKHKVNREQQKKRTDDSYRSSNKPEICKKRNYGKPCKYCDACKKLRDSGDEKLEQISYECGARSTFYMNVLDLDNKEAGVQIMKTNITNWRSLQDLMTDEDMGVDFTDPDDPKIILIRRKGKGLKTKYIVKVKDAAPTVNPKLFKQMHPLHKVMIMEAKGEIDEFFVLKEGVSRLYIFPPWGEEAEGNYYFEAFYHWNVDKLSTDEDEEEDKSESDDDSTEDDDDDFEEDTKKKKKGPQRKAKKSSEDEDEDEDDTDSDEDEDEKPKKKAKKSKSEDEDEDDDTDDMSDEPDVDDMNIKELRAYVASRKLSIKGWKLMDEKKLRKCVKKALEESDEDDIDI